MLTLLRQEAYKIAKGKTLWTIAIMLFVFQLLVAFASKQYHIMSGAEFFTSNGESSLVVAVIMVVIASTIITNEFVNKTIKNLLSRQYSRLQVFMSKLITIAWIYVGIVIINFLYTLIFKMVFFNSVSVTSAMIKSMVHSGIGTLVYLFLMTAFVVLISNIAKSSGGAIGIGVATIFASQLIAQLLALIIQKFSWFKYNPFNFFLVNRQYGNEGMKDITQFSLNGMTIGALVYGLIFFAIAYLIFKKRNI
ncbi:ABC transporter permease [Lactobacillaceae bacterium Scapto_B20]